MINTPESNPKFTDEQQRSLAEHASRLSVLQNEISVSSRTLFELKNDSVNASKEKSYQEELLQDTVVKVDEAQILLKTTQDNLILSKDELTKVTLEIDNKKTSLDELEASLKQKEEQLNSKEQALVKISKDLESKVLKLEENVQNFQNKVDKLNKVLTNL